jgi:HPt (histidine-containing phosphotransfer) domain-containing protein
MSPATNTLPAIEAAPVDERAAPWTAAELRSVWERQQDLVHERIALIERAIAALADGRLDGALARDAERAAHTLAGSVGMFGFVRAAQAALELELELARPNADHAPALLMLVAQVRAGIPVPVVSCPPLGRADSLPRARRAKEPRS